MRLRTLCLGILCFVTLSACQLPVLSKLMNDYNEQLHINAQLGFAIKHPQNWQRQKLATSSPAYRSDSVNFKVKDPHQQNRDIGQMLIRSLDKEEQRSLPDLLSQYLGDQPELKTGKVEPFAHPAGEALQLLGHDNNQGRLTIALQGRRHDFIISLDYPSSHFEELLPTFKDIVASFAEITQPATEKSE